MTLQWWRGKDLNLRPSGYEPDELPDCSTPRRVSSAYRRRKLAHRPVDMRFVAPLLDRSGNG